MSVYWKKDGEFFKPKLILFINTVVLLLAFLGLIFINSGYAIPKGKDSLLGRRDKPFSIHFVDKDSGWIVGDCGLVFKTRDRGESWQKVNMDPSYSLKDVMFIGEHGWTVGEEGLILHTTDGGNNWSIQKSESETFLMRVFFLDKSKGFIVGSYGTVLRTDDGGSSWKTVSLDWMELLPETFIEHGIFTLNLYDIFFIDKSKGWIVGDFGSVLYTSDGGDSWEMLRVGSFPHNFSVYFKNNLEGFVTGQNGLFLKTKDGGRKWEKVSLGTTKGLFNMDFRGNYGAIVGFAGCLYISNDEGKTWNPVRLKMRPPFPWLVDVAIIPSETSGGLIYVGKGTIRKINILDYVPRATAVIGHDERVISPTSIGHDERVISPTSIGHDKRVISPTTQQKK
jgi:photosystem II stability/assembly factor-like uncharacterized protein